MADTENQSSAASATSASGTPQTSSPSKKEKKAKNPRAKPSHPPTSEMVNNAIKGLKERGGSSLQAIKKYIAANYKVDAEKVAPFIKKYLKAAVATGSLVQTKGKGASGELASASSSSSESAKPSSGEKRKLEEQINRKKLPPLPNILLPVKR
uniref:Histone H1-like n=1 Tax=Diabrotica virgifera virgifera TaxID=50390 RepID=A0A6P7F9B4_DIAVI